jgi:cytochrome c-type biogenesis protein CcmH/NrfG
LGAEVNSGNEIDERAILMRRESGMAHDKAAAPTASPSIKAAKVYAMAGICLAVGLAIGYLLRASYSTPSQSPVQTPTTANGKSGGNAPIQRDKNSIAANHAAAGGHAVSLGDMKQMADRQAAPLLEKLKSDPKNSELLGQIGSTYHSLHQFKEAVGYYNKAIEVDPRNVAIRTKLAASLYRADDVDGAIDQLNQALRVDPQDANALFDLGMIKLHGKQDGKGALAAWQQLLKTNPQLSADRKATVQKLMASVMTMLSDQNGIQGAEKQ